MPSRDRYIVPSRYYAPLEFVTTITEASRRWYLGKSTIRNAIRMQHIAALKSGSTWLISVPSLVAHYGDPPALSGVSGGCQWQDTALQIMPERSLSRERDCNPQGQKAFAR